MFWYSIGLLFSLPNFFPQCFLFSMWTLEYLPSTTPKILLIFLLGWPEIRCSFKGGSVSLHCSSSLPLSFLTLSVPFVQVYFPYINYAYSMTHWNITILIPSHRLAPNATISLCQRTANPLEFTHVTGMSYVRTLHRWMSVFIQLAPVIWRA